ncbi:GNAT family N-acetyltransferase [uncultured Aquitalea sp.]|uniref:GNAT family N-acetyltransferase n=1 Tax=uncultured Aquitalea sp. TaxID=540272 RepID=UPI0025F2A716|nr:GNAT family N-acetyltransferase [uncultured Aquitalea sp.]
MNQLQLREATFDDANLIAQLHTRSWQVAYRDILPAHYLNNVAPVERETLWKRRFHYDNHLWVTLALWEGEPVGFVCVLPDGEPERGILLDNLHVMQGQQGRGIGKRLLLAAAAYVHQHFPGKAMHLWVYEDNHEARRFYSRMGGQMVDREKVVTAADSKAVALCYRWSPEAVAERAQDMAAA